MATVTIAKTTELNVIECAACGILFALTADLQRRRLEDGANFHCPSGHLNHYRDNEVARLKKQLVEEQSRSAFFKSEKERREAQLAEAEKKERRTAVRIGNGVCPCCNRTFQNLMRHMKTKHPEHKTGGVM